MFVANRLDGTVTFGLLGFKGGGGGWDRGPEGGEGGSLEFGAS